MLGVGIVVSEERSSATMEKPKKKVSNVFTSTVAHPGLCNDHEVQS